MDNNLKTEHELLDMFRFHHALAPVELIDDLLKFIETKKRESFNLGFHRGFFSASAARENNDFGGM